MRTRPDPRRADELHRAALTAYGLGSLAEAVRMLQKSVELAPANGEAWGNLGVLLRQAGRAEEAERALRRSCELAPRRAAGWNALGAVLLDRGDPAGAESALRRAAECDPAFSPARTNLALSRLLSDDLDGGLEAAQTATRLDPSSAAAWDALGCVLRAVGCVEDALDAFAAAIQRDPLLESAWSNLLFTIPCSDALPPEELPQKARLWGGRFANAAPPPSGRNRGARIRVGFLSPDFREHPVGRFIEPAFGLLDRSRFEVFAYSVSARADSRTERLRSLSDAWRDAAGLPDRELASLISADGLDVLVDLAGHTAGNRLPVLALRPARVQATYLGFPGTTGLPQIGALLADAHVAPSSDDGLYTETVLRMGAPYLCVEPDSDPPAPPADRPRHLTALVLANPAKISETAIRCWAELSAREPSLEIRFLYGSWRSEVPKRRVRTVFAEAGGDPSRLTFLPWTGRTECLREIAAADLVLDAFPYTGATTTLDALAMGTPVATLEGRGYASRMSAALLRWAGFGGEAASSQPEYVSRATELLHSGRGSERVRRVERFRDSALCRPGAWCRELERTLEALADGAPERP